ncbi:MAG TPA: amino acid permease [Verrucomicrobiota bacterium]|nr:amino acid permease [Verrucomicrobiales bacterium]HRI13248.1 amino acid permease [Verrucomicrobiota bacterium]
MRSLVSVTTPSGPDAASDEALLHKLGYRQELARRMSGFSNFAISLSIICILAGGITSFHVGLASAGGASIGLGWPLVCLFSLTVAVTMAQIASAFPTAGGLYHWGSLLGGRFCGWATAWFNLAGLVTVLAAINAGTFDFAVATFGLPTGANPALVKTLAVVGMTLLQALLNHYGIRLTTRLTDFSGWLILVVAVVLAGALLVATRHFEWARLWTLTNLSGLPEGAPVFPRQDNLAWLFCLGFLFPAYTITGFDASAHTSEETVGAAHNVPRGIVRSVVVSSLFGWGMIVALLLAMPDVRAGAEQGAAVVPWIMKMRLPSVLAWALLGAIVLSQFLCGLAALTSVSRMTYAFARDGGLPGSDWLRAVNPHTQSPSVAVWTSAVISALLIVLLRYETIAAIGTVFLYISYVLPVAAGFLAYGSRWTRFGPWTLGWAYRPLALVATSGCLFLLVIGVQPPNQQAVPIVGGAILLMLIVWFSVERRRFRGPPALTAKAA